MRNDFLSSATWSSHIDRLVSKELEKTSQGALSGPSTCVLKLIPFALIRIVSLVDSFQQLIQLAPWKKSRSRASSSAGAVVGMKCPAVSISSKRAPGIFFAGSRVPEGGRHKTLRPPSGTRELAKKI